MGIGLHDDVAEVLDLAADHAAATGTSITARTRMVVVNDRDRALPRVRRAEENGMLVLNPQAARERLLAAIESANTSMEPADPGQRRIPVVRWQEHWRPAELNVHDCVGRFDDEARANAVARATRRNGQPVPVTRRTVEQASMPAARPAGASREQYQTTDVESARTPRMPVPAAEVHRPPAQPAAEPAHVSGVQNRHDATAAGKGAAQSRPLLKVLCALLAVVTVVTLLAAGGPGVVLLLIIGVIALTRRLLRKPR